MAKLTRRIARHRLTDVSRLDPLSDDAVATLVRGALGDGAEDLFCSACADATGGNPLYLSQLIGAVLEQDIEPRASAAGRLTESGPSR